MTAGEVGELLQRWGPTFDVAVIGRTTLSSIPRLPGLSAEELLTQLSRLARFIMNVVSSTNNHVKFQRRYQALRRAWAETTRPEVKLWLEQKIGLATFDRSCQSFQGNAFSYACALEWPIYADLQNHCL
ncbi:unnamed protein product [Durusdinium trenchii]|uniref:Uncharacterized protein n=1 Tax=Durusdinium trenchii TaxID=1381693 RepID=A0ABP0KZR8_9DINO